MDIDFDRLRDDLIDYFGSALPIYPVSMMDLIEVENASDEELIQIALNNGFDLDNYKNRYIK